MTAKSPNKPRKIARQARSKRTVDAILNAAARILEEQGPAKLTTNHIAAQANISVGSVYQYFPNKQAILIQLMSSRLEAAMATRPEVMDRPVPLRQHIEAAVHWHLDTRRNDPLLFQRLFELQSEVLTHAERTAFEQFHEESVLRGLERHRDEIQVSDLNTAAIVVSQFMLAATQAAPARDPTLVDDERYEAEIVTALMAYLTR